MRPVYWLRMSPESSAVSPAALLADLRHARPFRHARIEKRKRASDPHKLVIGIGQMHGVAQGRFERFQARRIASIQAWIFHACDWLSDQGIHAFGQEGFSRPGEESFYGRLPSDLLAELKAEVREPGGVNRYLRSTAKRWRRAVHKKDADAIGKYLTGLNALNILQALEDDVAVFPIEQQDVHGALAQNIRSLHQAIESIEHTSAYQRVIAKQGRGLARDEYEAAVRRGQLVKLYNACLADDQRNESIFEEVMRFNETQDITVFVLGCAHRHAMLRLAKKHLPPDTLFVWITPAPLWRPVLLRRAVVLAFVLGFVGYAVFA
jgi:hypothetical protein